MTEQIDDLPSSFWVKVAREVRAYQEKWADLERRINEHCDLVDATIAQIDAERKLYGLDDL
jgi:hypothetical protein